MKKNGVFLFVMSHFVPEIIKIFVLCRLGADDVIKCDNMEVKTQNREYFMYIFRCSNVRGQTTFRKKTFYLNYPLCTAEATTH